MRMTVAFTLYAALLVTVIGLAFFFYLEHQEAKRVDVRLLQALDEIKEQLDDGKPHLNNIRDLVKDESGDLRVLNVAVLVLDSRSRVVSYSFPEASTWPLASQWRTQSMKHGGYILEVALNWNQVMERLRERTRALPFAGVVIVMMSSLGAWILVGRTLSPLEGLARQASAASAENLQVQLEAPSSDAEMTGLVETLNDLLLRLSQTAKAQTRFYAAASHELRTPLQTLSLLHEVTLSRPRENHEYIEIMGQSHIQTQRLIRLVQDLLLLNQLDMDNSRPESVLVDLADICEGELSQLRDSIAHKSLIICPSLPTNCELMAPWTHITMLMRNIIENAVKYARCGGRVEITVSPGRIRIWNECETSPNFETEKYFEAFYRPDASRNSQTGGNGLGLSICRAICEANAWNLAFTHENGGISVSVDFL
jgi:signal transduction histidine kinase